ncbi:MAG: hypothetical protein HY088_05660 [Ignavibacteriales bacterium]|nr:hypothetical protein [Ignavibacteriales bacterium]
MEEIFRLIRMPLLLLPIALWTAVWPLLLTGIVIAIPVMLIAVNAAKAIGFPFVFLGAAFTNERERVTTYLDKWRQANDAIASMTKLVKIKRGYSRVVAWGLDPKSVPDSGWIITTANVIGALVIAAVFSELVRTVLWIAFIVLVVLIVIGLLTGSD